MKIATAFGSLLLFLLIPLNSFWANAQSSTLEGRCVRWIELFQPRQAFRMAEICSGRMPMNDSGHPFVEEVSSTCPAVAGGSDTSSIGHCQFRLDAQANARMAISIDSDEPFDESLLQRLADPLGSTRPLITFFSASTFAVGESVLPAGLYRLVPSRGDGGWKVAFAKLDGEWNTSVPSGDLNAVAPLQEAKEPVPDVPLSSRDSFWLVLGTPTGCPHRQGHLFRKLGFRFADKQLFACIDPEPDLKP